jgi:tol-pal system protein YbgF
MRSLGKKIDVLKFYIKNFGMRFYIYFFSLFLFTVVSAEETNPSENNTPVFEPTKQDLSGRLARIEKILDNRALLDMFELLESLKVEVNFLRGEIEVQTRTVEQLKQKQRELYTDIDNRLQRAETNKFTGRLSRPLEVLDPVANQVDSIPLEVLDPIANQGDSIPLEMLEPVANQGDSIPLEVLDPVANQVDSIPLEVLDPVANQVDSIPLEVLDLVANQVDSIPLEMLDPVANQDDSIPLEVLDLVANQVDSIPLEMLDPVANQDDSSSQISSGEQGLFVETNSEYIDNKQVNSEKEIFDPQKAEAVYQRAFNLLKKSQYGQAKKAFKNFLKNYTESDYSDNAQYWLGETNYVMQKYDIAINEYQALLNIFPNSKKVSHALLKIGYSYAELGNVSDAEKILIEVVQQYPGTTAARLAEERLRKISLGN